MCSVDKIQFRKACSCKLTYIKNVFGCMGYITAGDDNFSDLSAVAFSLTPCCKNGDLYLWYVSNIKGSLNLEKIALVVQLSSTVSSD